MSVFDQQNLFAANALDRIPHRGDVLLPETSISLRLLPLQVGRLIVAGDRSGRVQSRNCGRGGKLHFKLAR